MKHTLQSQRGETIVEVLVSFLLLMIFTSMFVVSLRYARAMSQMCSFVLDGKNAHDDAPDAMAMLADLLTTGRRAKAVAVARPF